MEVIAIFIPIIAILSTGAVLTSFIYFRSKEKQMIIDKGLVDGQISELYRKKTGIPYLGLKIGIVVVGFGLGLGLGMGLEAFTGYEFYIPTSLFSLTGLGFVIAHFVAKKEGLKDKEKKEKEEEN